jgi:hypothetical protein
MRKSLNKILAAVVGIGLSMIVNTSFSNTTKKFNLKDFVDTRYEYAFLTEEDGKLNLGYDIRNEGSENLRFRYDVTGMIQGTQSTILYLKRYAVSEDDGNNNNFFTPDETKENTNEGLDPNSGGLILKLKKVQFDMDKNHRFDKNETIWQEGDDLPKHILGIGI